MSCMSHNFRLFLVSNLSVQNIWFYLLMYPWSQTSFALTFDIGLRIGKYIYAFSHNSSVCILYNIQYLQSSRNYRGVVGAMHSEAPVARKTAGLCFSAGLANSDPVWMILSIYSARYMGCFVHFESLSKSSRRMDRRREAVYIYVAEMDRERQEVVVCQEVRSFQTTFRIIQCFLAFFESYKQILF